MHISANVHLSPKAKPICSVATDGNGRRYLVLTIEDDGAAYPHVTLFPDDPAFLDKLANECERVVREFVGDVPQENVA